MISLRRRCDLENPIREYLQDFRGHRPIALFLESMKLVISARSRPQHNVSNIRGTHGHCSQRVFGETINVVRPRTSYENNRWKGSGTPDLEPWLLQAKISAQTTMKNIDRVLCINWTTKWECALNLD